MFFTFILFSECKAHFFLLPKFVKSTALSEADFSPTGCTVIAFGFTILGIFPIFLTDDQNIRWVPFLTSLQLFVEIYL